MSLTILSIMGGDDDRGRSTPSRFVLARMRRGLKAWQVADAAGLSRRRMWDIEHGRVNASAREVASIANVLHFPEAFFFRPHIEIPTLEEIN